MSKKATYEELELPESERKQIEMGYRTIVRNTIDGFWLMDMQGHFLDVNDTYCHLTGYNRDEMLNMSIFDIEASEKVEEIAKRIRTIKEVGQDRFEMRQRNKDGKVVEVELSVNYLPADGGRMSVFIRDITERKLEERSLKQSEELFRIIFQVSPDSITITGPNDGYVDVNPGFTIGSGYTREEALGKTAEDLNIWVDDSSLDVVRTTLAEKGIINNLEVKVRGKDGSISDSFFSATVFEMNGEFHVLSVSRNISELKQAQKERSRFEAQLQQVQKMESIGTLAGGIAHDFNNLLMSIQGKTSILLYNLNKDDAVYDQIKSIAHLIKSGSEVTSQLLGLARRGKFEVKTEDLNKLVENSSKMFATTKKEIKIYSKYQKYVWAVEVDKNQIDQVLLNLFVNASQAMPNGGDLYIETENLMLNEDYVKPHLIKPGKFVKISVTDTGTGMDEATLPNIFDPFFTTKDVGTETGLGLASAYGIIKNHNGIINVYSEKGVGSTFNIYLPATDKKVVEDIEPQSKIKKGTETILFIDDEQRVIDTGKEMLEILGYKVLLASSGIEAIETYRNKYKIIDLVILDMILPEMGGSVIFDRLRNINPNIKVLLSSGFTQDGMAEEILDKGCNGFIQKPFTLEQFSHKIRKILSMK